MVVVHRCPRQGLGKVQDASGATGLGAARVQVSIDSCFA